MSVRASNPGVAGGHAKALLDSLLSHHQQSHQPPQPRTSASAAGPTSQISLSSPASASASSSASSATNLPAQLHLTPAYKPHKPSSLSSSASASASEDGAERRASVSGHDGSQQGDPNGDNDDHDHDSLAPTSPPFSSSFKAAQLSMQSLNHHQQNHQQQDPEFASHHVDDASSNRSAPSQAAEILTLLSDTTLDEEDKIDKVRASLASALYAIEGVVTAPFRLDNLVLELMHRHREDIHPTGATFSSIATQSPSRRPASVRSFSSNRPWSSSKPPFSSPAASVSGLDSTPSTPQQLTSPRLATIGLSSNSSALPPGGSPKPHPGVIGSGSPRASPRPWNRTLSNLSTTSVTSSVAISTSVGSPISSVPPALSGTSTSRPASPSPFGSPRLNVAASEFRPRNSSSSSLVSAPAGGFTPAKPVPWLTRRPSSNASSTNLALANKSHAGAGDDDDDEFSPFGSSKPTGPGNLNLTAPYAASAGGYDGELAWYSSDASATSSNGGWDPSPLSSAVAASTNVTSTSSFEDGQDGSGFGAAGMTPFDLLYSILVSGTKQGMAEWSPEQVEEALAAHNYDFEKTLNAIWENGGKPISGGLAGAGAGAGSDLGSRNKPLGAPASPATAPSIRSGVNIVPREAFQTSFRGSPAMSNRAAAVGRGGYPASPVPRAATPNAAPVGVPALGGATGGRVCRYFLAGECRRSDCKFSHDLSRAVCRYWLKGQCAHNPCHFLHDYDALNMLATGITSGVQLGEVDGGADIADAGEIAHAVHVKPAPPETEDFPELGLGSAASNSKSQRAGASADPTRNRWAAAVQKKATGPTAALQREDQGSVSLFSRGGTVRGSNAASASSNRQGSGSGQIRSSGRIPLRAPLLLPTLNTGKLSAQSYAAHREDSLVLAEQRNKILARASEAFRRGDFGCAKKLSQEASDINSRFQDESRSAARKLLRERMREIRAKVTDPIEAGSAVTANQSDEAGAKGMKGKVVGGGLGICLGVVRAGALQTSMPSSMACGLSVEERSESLLDLHGLHSQEAVEVVEEFLLGLEREGMQGLAYLAIGREKHSSRGTDRRRVKLGGFIKQFLGSYAYPFAECDGVLVVDPCTHV